MSSVRRITKNAVLLNVARIISTLGKFFLFIYVARVLGQEVLGQFTLAIVFTSFFAIAISLGMDDLLVREVARDSDSSAKYLGNMLLLRLFLSLIVFGIMAVTINVMDYPPDTRMALYIFGGYVIFTNFSFLFRANFRAFEKMEWDALLEILEALITTTVGLVLIFAGYGLIPLCLTFLVTSVITAAAGFAINARRFAAPRFEFDLGFWKSATLKAAPFSVFALYILYPRIDTILLSSFQGDAVVGDYNAAYQIVIAFSPLVMNFMIALVPLISRYFISAQTMLTFTYEKSFKYLVMVAFPVSVGGMVLAGKIIGFLYGAGYENSVLALQILVWNCLLLAMSRPMFYVLGAINRQGTCAIIIMSAFALSIGLNFYAIPRWSFTGSGVITLVTGVLVTLAALYSTRRYGFALPALKIIFKPLVASSIMGVAIFLADTLLDAGLLVLVLLGSIIYIFLLAVLRSFSKDDLSLFRELLRGRKREQAESPGDTSSSRYIKA